MSDEHYGSVLEYHRHLLADSVRTETFRRGIAEVVREGDVVLDIGTGTGVLAYFAALAGARQVYAIDRGSIIELARLVCRANGLEDRVEFIHGVSQDVQLPEPADVLITETLWNFGLGEGILGTVIDARERLLRADARIVPRSVEVVAAAIEAPGMKSIVELWSSDLYGLDFSPGRVLAANNWWNAAVPESALLGSPATIASVDLSTVDNPNVIGSANVRIERAGTMNAIAGWFRAQLSDNVSLTNEPPNQTPSWNHALLPLEQPIAVTAGDEIELWVGSTANGSQWAWRAALGGSTAVQQSTLWGSPVPAKQGEERPG